MRAVRNAGGLQISFAIQYDVIINAATDSPQSIALYTRSPFQYLAVTGILLLCRLLVLLRTRSLS